MTLVVGIIAKDGAVLASDSRMTSSSISSNDTVDKIIKLGDNIAIGISGDGGLGVHLLKLIKETEQLDYSSSIILLVERLRESLRRKFDDYYISQPDPEKRPPLSFLIMGYDKENKLEAYQLSSIDNFIPRPSSTGFECIGIPYIAEYILNRFYEKEITTKNAEILAAYCIQETQSQSHQVGGDIKVASFSPAKTFSIMSPSELKIIQGKCDKFLSGNKAFFYPENREEL